MNLDFKSKPKTKFGLLYLTIHANLQADFYFQPHEDILRKVKERAVMLVQRYRQPDPMAANRFESISIA